MGPLTHQYPVGDHADDFYGLSEFLMPHLTAEMIGDFSACGGLIQLLNALRIAKLKNPPVADYIPSLVLVFLSVCSGRNICKISQSEGVFFTDCRIKRAAGYCLHRA